MLGLIQAETKNMEKMAEAVPGTDSQRFQHFLTNSPWDHQKVMDHVARDADKHLGYSQDCSLSVDETSFIKKGDLSVGVKRQYSGRVGKVDNCQVAVMANLCAGKNHTLIDCRLFLPEEWVNDPSRCKKAGIPDDKIVFKKKSVLAVEMIRHARAQGLRFKWCGADGFFGNDPWFLRALEDDGETFMVDVHKDQMIWVDDPRPFLPAKRGNSTQPVNLQPCSTSIKIENWAEQQPATAWKKVTIRESTKGTLNAEILHGRVWLWDGKENIARLWHLVVRREVGSPKTIKYSLSNAPAKTPVDRLAFMQSQRYWIERSFEDGKSNCGMADYQVRRWSAWHHHMAMVMIAMLFMLEERLLNHNEKPLLSCADIIVMLKHFLPKAAVSDEDVFRVICRRHERRQASIDNARKQRAQYNAGSM